MNNCLNYIFTYQVVYSNKNRQNIVSIVTAKTLLMELINASDI